MLISRDPLPKTMSFILKSSVLERVLSEADIEIDTILNHVSGRIFFDAHFWPPNAHIDHERLYIRAGTVPRAVAHPARVFVEASILPELVRWIGEILALPPDSPKRRVQRVFWRERPAQLEPGP